MLQLPASPLDRCLKNRNHSLRRDFQFEKTAFSDRVRLAGLHQSANALGAQNLTNFLIAFQHTHRLEVGAESPLCQLLRPRAAATESCLLTTMCTLRHLRTSFPTRYVSVNIPDVNNTMQANTCPDNSRTILPQTRLLSKKTHEPILMYNQPTSEEIHD